MIRRKLYEGRNNTPKAKKLYEEVSPEFDAISEILVGAFCYGDDGENAEIDSVFLGRGGVPMIQFTQEDGRFYIEELANYLGAIDLSDDDREFVEAYLNRLGLMESANPVRRKLILNESAGAKGVSIILDADDSLAIQNFINWSRTLLKEVGIPVDDEKAERVFIKEGNLYYQGPYLGFKPGKAKMLQARLQKYAGRETYPQGLKIDPAQGVFIAPFTINGNVKINTSVIAPKRA